MRLATAAAVNDLAVLARCLAASPDIRAGTLPLATFEGYRTAGLAYNAAIAHLVTAEWIIFAHQDVYLPAGFGRYLTRQLMVLTAYDPDWAVAGVVGTKADGTIVGHSWSSGLGRVIGTPDGLPQRVESLDEMLLVVRTRAGLRFDPALPSFHLYGTDIVQAARAAGWSAYAIDAPAIHHSRPVADLGGGYRAAYRYMQGKWRDLLPIPTTILPVTHSLFPLLWKDARIRLRHRGRRRIPAPIENPARIARAIGFEPLTQPACDATTSQPSSPSA